MQEFIGRVDKHQDYGGKVCGYHVGKGAEVGILVKVLLLKKKDVAKGPRRHPR